MNRDKAVVWLRGALERRVGAATRSLVAAVEAAADVATTVEEFQESLEKDLQFASPDAEFIARGFLERLAEADPCSACPDTKKDSQEDREGKKRRLAENVDGTWLPVSHVSMFGHGIKCRFAFCPDANATIPPQTYV